MERGTYQPYGAAESDYRPERWGAFREDYRFTGKEEDVEVGLTYFGKRYLSAGLGRWASADPLTVHGLGKADANVYAYVRGAILTSTDPTGLEDISWGDVAKRAMLALCPIYSAYEEAKAGNYAMAVARAVPGTNLLLAINVEGPLGTVEVAKAGYACASGTCGAPEKETLASAAVVAIVSGGLMKALPEGGGVGLIKPRPARVRPPLTKAQRIAELNAIRDDTIASLKGEPAEATPELSLQGGGARAAGGVVSTADDLASAAQRAKATVGPGRGPVYGTRARTAFRAEVEALGNPNLNTEVSYLNGRVVPYGTRGSVRLDVVEGPLSAPTAVFDFKTGSAALSPARIAQIRSHLPGGGSGVPVLEVR